MLYFGTKNRDYYVVDDNGNIGRERFDNKPILFSGQWKFMGIKHVKRNEFIPFSALKDALLDLELLYKNGNPQYTVVDNDHGTLRTWGNTRYHGIGYMYFKDS